eukprot:SM000026S09001  [mRNA]  locus=s26:964828:966696:+ [translate_table: standard]
MPSPGRRGDQLPPTEAAAYRLALEAGADCMEVDVSRTADGGLVALHVRHAHAPTTVNWGFWLDNHLVIARQAWAGQVVQLDAGQYHHSRLLGERVLTLAEALRVRGNSFLLSTGSAIVLQTLGGKLKTIIIDVKTGPPLHEVSLAYDVLNVVRQAGCHNCLVWSKLDGVVAELKELEPAIKAGFIVMTDSRTGQASSLLRMIEPEVVGVFHGLITPQLVAEVHRTTWVALDDSVQRWEGGSGVDV